MAVICRGVAVKLPCPKLNTASWPVLCSSLAVGSTPALAVRSGAMGTAVPKPNSTAAVPRACPPKIWPRATK